MRILYHHRTLGDGAEGIHIRAMIEAFETLGHDVTVSSFAPAEHLERQARLWATVKTRLPQFLFELAAVFLNVSDYLRFRWANRRDPPHLVYKRHAIFDLGVILAARSLGIPVMLEVNCVYSSPEYVRFEPLCWRSMARWFEAHAIRNSTVVIAVSTPMGDLVRRVAGETPCLVVLPNGVNPDRFNIRRARGETVRTRHGLGLGTVVGWAGILRAWHRVDMLLEAVAQIPNLTVLIVGDGPDQSRLRRMVQDLGLVSRVVFAGRVPHDQMVDYIAAMDIAVASGDQTGHASPMKLLEYMAMERAVAAPRQPNIEDIIDDGVDGVLFAAQDVADLTRVLARLAVDDALRLSLGRNARIKVERERNWVNNATRLLSVSAASTGRQPHNASCSE